MRLKYQTELSPRNKRRQLAAIIIILGGTLVAGIWLWRTQSTSASKATSAVRVVSALAAKADVPATLTANGTVTGLQAVEVRPQISATIKAIHIKEGQRVRKGARLFTLDTRTEDANLAKAEAQIMKDRADLANAERDLERKRDLFRQEYISRAEFDAAQNLVEVLRSQLAIDQASMQTSRVSRSFGEIIAPIAGRTGAITVYPGSLVQPNSTVLVNITQIDPIGVSFTLPERELAHLQQAFAKGVVPVEAKLDAPGGRDLKGHLAFIDNAVDTASGTIRLKAEFPNLDNSLWPGMFVKVTLAPRILAGAVTVPVQAVQTGPEKKFLYAIGKDSRAASVPVEVRLIQDGIAVVEGIEPGTRVVVEGAQNLRPGDLVVESEGKGKAEDGNGVEKGGANQNAGKP